MAMQISKVVYTTDILIVGAGLAGLFLALRLAPRSCVVLSPGPLGHAASSAWAQGGIAAALGADDSPAWHAKDTELAGDGLVDPQVAALLANDAAARIQDLVDLGVPFDRTVTGELALGLGAGATVAVSFMITRSLAGQIRAPTMVLYSTGMPVLAYLVIVLGAGGPGAHRLQAAGPGWCFTDGVCQPRCGGRCA